MSSTETPCGEAEKRSALLASTPLNCMALALAKLPLPIEQRADLSNWLATRNLRQLLALQERISEAIQEIALVAFALDSPWARGTIGQQSQSPKASPSPTSAETDTVREGGTGAKAPDFSEMTLEELKVERTRWQKKLDGSPRWGAAVAFANEMRGNCEAWIERREAESR